MRSKAQRYLAEGFELRSTALQVEENWFGLICVLPHPHRIALTKANGSYQDANGRDRSEFSAGDVFGAMELAASGGPSKMSVRCTRRLNEGTRLGPR